MTMVWFSDIHHIIGLRLHDIALSAIYQLWLSTV